MSSDIDTLKRQIKQLESLVAEGALSAEAAAESRATLEKRLVEAVMNAPTPAPASAPSAAPAVAATLADAPAPSPRLNGKLALGLAAVVVVVGAVGYKLLGNPEGWNVAPGAQPAATAAAEPADDAASGPHPMTAAQIEGMVAKLAERMKSRPDDAEGWLMLGRSYAVLGKFDDAIPAYRKVLALSPKNAQALADLGDALAVKNHNSFAGEPEKLVALALEAEPDNLKALLLAGTVAFDKKDFAGAIRHWERAVKVGPAESDFVKQAQAGLQEARTLSGGKVLNAAPEAPPAAPALTPATTPPAAAGKAVVAGRVELGKAFAGKAGPDDTVFIYARPATGPRMPLALMKRKVSELPIEFELTDAQAMSPAASLSTASQVVVMARISKSGQAAPSPGDLQGASPVVAVGTRGLKIVIDEATPAAPTK